MFYSSPLGYHALHGWGPRQSWIRWLCLGFRCLASDSNITMNIVVLGGGITGLSSAFHLSRRFPDARITLIDKADRLGGWIKSERVDAASSSVVLETGPRTLRPVDKATLELVSSPLLHKNIAHPSLVDPPLGPHPTTHHNSQNLPRRKIPVSLCPRPRRSAASPLQSNVSSPALV
jgi:hypothetical protein